MIQAKSLSAPSERAASEEPPRARTHCPTCGTPRTDSASCHRCKSDLSQLVAVEKEAETLHVRALKAYREARFLGAAELAESSERLVSDPETLRLLACARLRSGDFQGARDATARLVLLEDRNDASRLD